MIMPANNSGTEWGILAALNPGRIGHLYSPGGQRGPWPEIPFALDNRKFVTWTKGIEWSEPEWLTLLRWALLSGQMPVWCLVPDEVANRLATLALWEQYAPVVRQHGFRCAFAVQDGMTFDDVPDSECMLFLGGSTEWKDAAIEPWCARFPGRVHVGRVNRWDRLVRSWRAGAVSVDGTGWYHKTNGQNAELRKFLRETRAA